MVGRSYDWLWGLAGGIILSCILKWWLNGVWSEEITWPIYIVIHSAHAVVFFIIRTWIRGWIKEEETPSVWESIYMSLHWAGLYLALFPLFVLYPVSYDGIGAVGTQVLMQEGWWNPAVWGECWLKQMQVTGWVGISVYLTIIGGLIVYVIKANWDREKWGWRHIAVSISFFVVGSAVALWYAPITIHIVGAIVEGIGKFLRLVANVLDFLAP